MPSAPTLYDLVLLLSLNSDEDARGKVLADVEAEITRAGGTLARNQTWGRRPTTFAIDHQAEADYRLIQFTGPPALLDSLSHNLRIADEVLRFRIIKVLPGTPEPPHNPPPIIAAAAAGVASAAAVPSDGDAA